MSRTRNATNGLEGRFGTELTLVRALGFVRTEIQRPTRSSRLSSFTRLSLTPRCSSIGSRQVTSPTSTRSSWSRKLRASPRNNSTSISRTSTGRDDTLFVSFLSLSPSLPFPPSFPLPLSNPPSPPSSHLPRHSSSATEPPWPNPSPVKLPPAQASLLLVAQPSERPIPVFPEEPASQGSWSLGNIRSCWRGST